MKYLLAMSMLLCQVFCFAGDRDENEFYQLGYKIEVVEYDNHEYIIIRMKHTDNFTVMHSPECKACQEWAPYISCVEMKPGGKYVVDQSGCCDT